MANQSPCVIVGRCADAILRDYQSVSIFVYADMEARIRRCRSRCGQEESYSEKEWRQKIISIDKKRAKYYEFYTGKRWGEKHSYDFCINTARLDIKSFSTHFARFLEAGETAGQADGQTL